MEELRDSKGAPIVRGSRVMAPATGKKGTVAATSPGVGDVVFVVFDGEAHESYMEPSELTMTE